MGENDILVWCHGERVILDVKAGDRSCHGDVRIGLHINVAFNSNELCGKSWNFFFI
jgi:hypothetical protein